MRKRLIGLLTAVVVSAAVLAGCQSSGTGSAAETNNAATQTETTDESKTTTAAETKTTDLTGKTLMIYCGAGMTEPFQKIADAFKSETGCEMNVSYANAGQIQSQITTSGEGDLFIAGSADELQPVQSSVTKTKQLVKHIPVLAVASGNPKGINGLSDLTKEDVTFLMGDAESTPIGKIAKKALTEAGIFDQVTIGATTTTAPQLATAIASGEADAAIVWKENCSVSGVEIVNTTDLDKYVKTVPAAELNSAADQETLDVFYEYLDSDTAKGIWTSYGYELAE